MSVVAIEHIEVDDKGVARIAGKRTKVIQIVMDKRAYGWNPEDIREQHPHLTLGEIHAAFAYYYDHQRELDEQILRDLEEVETLRAQAGPSPVAAKLRALGKLP